MTLLPPEILSQVGLYLVLLRLYLLQSKVEGDLHSVSLAPRQWARLAVSPSGLDDCAGNRADLNKSTLAEVHKIPAQSEQSCGIRLAFTALDELSTDSKFDVPTTTTTQDSSSALQYTGQIEYKSLWTLAISSLPGVLGILDQARVNSGLSVAMAEKTQAAAVYSLITLVIPGNSFKKANPLISRLVLLVRLEVSELGAEVLDAIVLPCGATLVYLRFTHGVKYSSGLCRLFAAYPRLKECFGDGNVVQAEDPINGPE
ncbi:MAG: hypothetical protein J3R72DRAFT_494850 [Linnemannia gamsii]|nr:MAG: hypothetical protein J3R72DRAFT_494850 [Linnemannia gamsii]